MSTLAFQFGQYIKQALAGGLQKTGGGFDTAENALNEKVRQFKQNPDRGWSDTYNNGQLEVPGMAERSYLAQTNYELARENLLGAHERQLFHAAAPAVGGLAGRIIGGQGGQRLGSMLGTGAAMMNDANIAHDQKEDRLWASVRDAGPRPPVSPILKAQQSPDAKPLGYSGPVPRPVTPMPPRGVGPRPVGAPGGPKR